MVVTDSDAENVSLCTTANLRYLFLEHDGRPPYNPSLYIKADESVIADGLNVAQTQPSVAFVLFYTPFHSHWQARSGLRVRW